MFWEFLKKMRESSPESFMKIVWGSVAAGVLQGFIVAAIGMGVSGVIRAGVPGLRAMLLFLLCTAGYYGLFRRSMKYAIKMASDKLEKTVVNIADILRSISYPAYLDMDQHKLYEVLLGNNDMVLEAARFIGPFFSGLCMVLWSFFYALTISPAAAVLLFAIIAAMSFAYVYMERNLVQSFKIRSAREDAFLGSLKDIVQGFIELKMNAKRSDSLYSKHILRLCREYFKAREDTDMMQVRSTSFYMSFSYIPVGATVFLLSVWLSLDAVQITELTTMTLFAVTPVLGLCLFIPTTARAVIILRGLEDFTDFLKKVQDDDNEGPVTPPEMEKIEMRDVEFVYPSVDKQNQFRVKIDNFTLSRGELVMLRGGNGSGKSTFMRLMAGLLRPTRGEIMINGMPVSSIGYTNYRNIFSCVFTDFYLFDGLYGCSAKQPEIDALIEKLGLSGKLSVRNGFFSTTDLSSGQRKRVALLTALLEGRHVFLFDEVAADFDHNFREYFYRTILPELKAGGNSLLVISHDDRYFDVADRVLTMREGEFTEN